MQNWDISDSINTTAIAVDNKGGVYITGEILSNKTNWDYVSIRYDAATGNKIWKSFYNGGGNSNDFATAIAVDNTGGVYVTGSNDQEFTGSDYVTVCYDAATGNKIWDSHYSKGGYFGEAFIAVNNQGGVFITGTTYSNETGYDITTIRYDAATGEQKWVKTYNGGSNYPDWARDIAVDHMGSVYVTGLSSDTYIDSKYITIRYDAATGDQKWTNFYNGEGNNPDEANAIAVDNVGGVYVTGTSQTGNNSYLFITIYYEGATGIQKWITSYSGKDSGLDEAGGIVTDNQGSVIITGRDYTKNTGPDIVIVSYNATTGGKEWEQRFNSFGSQSDTGIAVTIDAAGNSYVTGTSYNDNSYKANIVTIKYSPTGEELWIKVYEKNRDNHVSGIAVDNQGGVYVTGRSETDYITIRYDAYTGKQSWSRRYNGQSNGWDQAVDIAVDSAGGIYVTGSSQTGDNTSDYVTIRYDATTGKQIWATPYKGKSISNNGATAIAVDNQGGVYVTGQSDGDYATVRYEATTGKMNWERRYNGEANGYDEAIDIILDNLGSVYVTGNSSGIGTFSDYVTIRYMATTGEQKWDSRFDAGRNGYDYVAAIAVDSTDGVYVTGRSQSIGGEDVEYAYDYATVGYKASTGDEMWRNRYDNNGSNDFSTSVVVDNQDGVYVTGHSEHSEEGSGGGVFKTIKYNSINGAQIWDIQTARGVLYDTGRDIALDSEGSVIVTGYSFSLGTGNDFLTVKYRQNQCPALADAAIQGNSTAAIKTNSSIYSLSDSSATSFTWRITNGSGADYTSFSGQGTNTIKVNWPSEPDMYKMHVTYGGEAGCPTRDTTLYVHVFDPQAGFVTGGGWITSPVNSAYEFMQKGTKAYFGLMAKYKKGAENRLQGETQLLLENGSFYFRSISQLSRTLVISGNQAFYRGRGKVSYRDDQGKLVTDPRKFMFLISATDGQLNKAKEADKLRILVWEIQQDGTRGAVVYDNQIGCSTNLGENAEACQTIGGGNIVIHRNGVKSVSSQSALAAAEPERGGLQAYPTAFSKRTTLSFTSGEDAEYTLELYDLKGALIKRIAAGSIQSGQRYEHELQADGLDKGMYLVRLTSGSTAQTVKLVVQQ
ncbi:T9SS type A sorting domain-containing protein [Pontibacter ruber]|uniref:T9SS type A sorting domain-containing protein n=1 Tax=Pontibacter ruber TaxID=1343895 RepID=A0ABW5CZD9_9BACT|nr:T9SS type A sorting domain-containing protein [Pontibacter ruber]